MESSPELSQDVDVAAVVLRSHSAADLAHPPLPRASTSIDHHTAIAAAASPSDTLSDRPVSGSADAGPVTPRGAAAKRQELGIHAYTTERGSSVVMSPLL
jgi:hypothetical protein